MSTPTKIKQLAVIRDGLANKTDSALLESSVRDFVELKTTIEAELKATWKALEAYMIENDIKDVYNLTIAQKTSWKVTGTLPPRYYKQVLDTTRLNFDLNHDNKVPKGATFTTSKYLTKTSRKVEKVA